jgi:predicted RNase H-like nuclease (RuvC/YqgF family)
MSKDLRALFLITITVASLIAFDCCYNQKVVAATKLQLTDNTSLKLFHEQLALQNELEHLRIKFKAESERLEQLRIKAADADLIQKEIAQYKDKLEVSIFNLRKEIELRRREQNKLLAELNTLSRISVEGQTVKLARSIARREATWINEHWNENYLP